MAYVKSVEKIYHHRNGVGGVGFYVVLFTCTENGEPMIGFVFDDSPGYVAVMKRRDVAEGKITMQEGATYRGDVFEADLRAAIKKFEEAERAVKLEAIPVYVNSSRRGG